MVTTRITEAVPMIIPRAVSSERTRLARSASQENRRASATNTPLLYLFQFLLRIFQVGIFLQRGAKFARGFLAASLARLDFSEQQAGVRQGRLVAGRGRSRGDELAHQTLRFRKALALFQQRHGECVRR